MNISRLFIKVLRRIGIVDYLNLYVNASFDDGLKIVIPVLRGTGESNLTTTEPWMLDLFKSCRGHFDNGTFLDVGFNIGQTLIKYRAVFANTKYVGFDPNPFCSYYVRELVQCNRWTNIDLIPVGLSEQTAIKELFLYYESDADSTASIIKEFRGNTPVKQSFYIPVFDIRSITPIEKMIDSVSCIKIDVEGGELEVIQCCADLINRKRPLVLLEILPVYHESNKIRLDRQLKVEAIFRGLRYHCYLIVKSNQNRLQSLKKIDAIGINTDINQCDYIFVPEERQLTID